MWFNAPRGILEMSQKLVVLFLVHLAASVTAFAQDKVFTTVYTVNYARTGNSVQLEMPSYQVTPNSVFTWTDARLAFYLLKKKPSGGKTVYRCFFQGSAKNMPLYFLSLDPVCEGQDFMGLVGYASAVQTPETQTPLYSCLVGNGTHRTTTQISDCPNKKGDLLGYVALQLPLTETEVSSELLSQTYIYKAEVEGEVLNAIGTQEGEKIDGYTYDRPGMHLLNQANENTEILYRCSANPEDGPLKVYFLWKDQKCLGEGTVDYLAGYIQKIPTRSIQTPLYMCVADEVIRWTSQPDECKGVDLVLLLGFVPTLKTEVR